MVATRWVGPGTGRGAAGKARPGRSSVGRGQENAPSPFDSAINAAPPRTRACARAMPCTTGLLAERGRNTRAFTWNVQARGKTGPPSSSVSIDNVKLCIATTRDICIVFYRHHSLPCSVYAQDGVCGDQPGVVNDIQPLRGYPSGTALRIALMTIAS